MVTIKTILIEETLKKQKGIRSCHYTKRHKEGREGEQMNLYKIENRKMVTILLLSIITLTINRLNSNHNT